MKIRELITLLQRQNPELEVTTEYGQITSVATEYVRILDKDMVFIRTHNKWSRNAEELGYD